MVPASHLNRRLFCKTMAEDTGILFIQTGGTIDKEYPRTMGGYSFEFGDKSAAQKIISALTPGVSFE